MRLKGEMAYKWPLNGAHESKVPHLPHTRLALGFILLTLTPFDIACGASSSTLYYSSHSLVFTGIAFSIESRSLGHIKYMRVMNKFLS